MADNRYDHRSIEKKWQQYWAKNQTFKADNHADKPKYYALDMFPYPSGAGLHVGHPLGYIASDIVSRYKRHTGHNVLHPMGYDSFGLPAEQYAIQTGQHPAKTTKENIARYREQLDRIGFSFDWSREVRTSDPDYYKFTQEIFLKLFDSWYDKEVDKARPIEDLIVRFRESGTKNLHAHRDENAIDFTPEEWQDFSKRKQQEILLDYRIAYLADTEVNWCPALGTVLANDEIVNGVSERGGHPVERKKMRQWMMRITAYAERLLQDLDKLDWSDAIKEIQRNWIGKSEGAMVTFRVMSSEFRDQTAEGSSEANSEVSEDKLTTHNSQLITCFTTRPDTIYGVTFLTLAPEHELVDKITSDEQKEAVEEYKKATAQRSERERMADVKSISGVFTGAYGLHPLTGEKLPIWIGDYVLAGYGTGAVMAVPCGDERDHAFAKYFSNDPGMPAIKNIFQDVDVSEEAHPGKDDTKLKDSHFLNGMSYESGAVQKAIEKLEEKGAGYGKTNYRLRDAVFSRQRYWGEPIPIYYKDGMPHAIDKKHLPLELPKVDEYLPTEDGAPPLGRATRWFWDEEKCEVVMNPENGVRPTPILEHSAHTSLDSTTNPSPALPKGKGAVSETEIKKVLPSGKDLGWVGEIRKRNYEETKSQDLPGYFTAKPEIGKTLLKRAEEMRKNPTKAEEMLWRELRGKQLGAKFRRQHPIDKYIPDFVCLSLGLIIEVDGDYHNYQVEQDTTRDHELTSKFGFIILRFTNEEVLNDLELVMEKIRAWIHLLSDSLATTNPSPALPKGKGAVSETEIKKVLPSGKDLGRVGDDEHDHIYPLELNTMPGWAGSSWYMFRYMDTREENQPINPKAQEYWKNVDLYIGGSEHATGHLLYSRFWTKFLHDHQQINVEEPFRKMINQGMILGESAFANEIEIETEKRKLISASQIGKSTSVRKLQAPVELVNTSNELNIEGFKKWRPDLADAEFITEEDGTFKVSREVEKMSKSKFNVVNPDDICDEYGADTLRLYEMFLGPLEQAKPWNTAGITGVHGFLKKLWKLYHDQDGFRVSDKKPSKESLKTLHQTIKKVREDIEGFSFNTTVSQFMICVNELTAQKCDSREILEPLAILVSPYAPHIAEELWELLGHKGSIATVEFPKFEEKHLVEDTKTYPISFNGKMRFTMELPLDSGREELQGMVEEDDRTQQYLEGKTPKKVIVVPGKIINFVV